MKIDAIITCVGVDALKMVNLTYQQTLKFVDSLTIVTQDTDYDTIKFCESSNLKCIFADFFSFKGQKASFNKGAGINAAIKSLKDPDWILHLDGDIWIANPNSRKIMERECTDIECFYGVRRTMFNTIGEFANTLAGNNWPDEFLTHFGIGFGYFQLWNVNSAPIKRGLIYPESPNTADSDWIFRNYWGDCIKNDTEYTGKLRKLSFDVWHLGNPGVWNGKSFWEN